jgi:mono/diheme cytochrome c family protein
VVNVKRVWGLGGIAVACTVAAVGAAGQGRSRGTDVPRQQPPQVLTESLAGRDSFDRYCAPCHGVGGRGDGPVATELKTRPADLTRLAGRNNGSFPAERVSAFVTGTGRSLPAHGTAEMPVWGPTFRAFEADARVRERIKNLVAYLGTIQQATSSPDSQGAQLFRTHCASCHGPTGTGGATGDRLRQGPPDLTSFTARNGGIFPSERVAKIIDGRDVPSHGDRQMPVWGNAFRTSREGLSADEVRGRIAAIVAFLEAIQRRNG